jgi:hypothetical protein
MTLRAKPTRWLTAYLLTLVYVHFVAFRYRTPAADQGHGADRAPAIANNVLYIRAEKHLYAFAESK